ncbi:MAG: dienelactone hydrolase family protein [Acidobacteriia bacterium]|nr:dienelactone hydrolase family protein [Terriglobia bacterium]
MPKMKSDVLEYRHEGVTFRGRMVHDAARTAKLPGVLIVHEAWGLGEHVRGRADRLAEMGYVAFAVDMFGEGRQASSNEEGLGWTRDLRANVPLLRGRIAAAHAALLEQPQVDPGRVAAIGYCFGGTTALELARSGARIAGVVSFHGGLATTHPAEPGAVSAKLLVTTGADDPFIPPAQVQAFVDEMTAARADLQLIIYSGTKHSFTNRRAGERGIAALEYNQLADERSWNAMHTFFHEIFGLHNTM